MEGELRDHGREQRERHFSQRDPPLDLSVSRRDQQVPLHAAAGGSGAISLDAQRLLAFGR
jgi:hypothetical protein